MIPSRDWSQYLVNDQVLAQSYTLVGDFKRSWMKKYIAYLFSYYGHEPRTQCVSSARERAGFIHDTLYSPVPEVLVIAHSYPKIWNRLLASVIPAISAGVEQIYICLIKNHEEPCPEILTSLELAGVENIFLIDGPETFFANILDSVRDAGLIDLCAKSPMQKILFMSPGKAQHYIRLFFARRPRALIWTENHSAWDYDILKWAHPDMEFTVGGPLAHKAPSGFVKTDAAIQQLLSEKYDLFLGPEDIFRASMVARGFSPGMEPFWLWPELDKSFFRIHRTYWKEIE
jgi:hypothetical protein